MLWGDLTPAQVGMQGRHGARVRGVGSKMGQNRVKFGGRSGRSMLCDGEYEHFTNEGALTMTDQNNSQDKLADLEPSGVVRHLGLIKALAVIMAVLIVAALVVIVVTIYSRLQARDEARAATQIELAIPSGAAVTSASSDKSGLTIVLDGNDGQEIWRLTATGRVIQKISIKPE